MAIARACVRDLIECNQAIAAAKDGINTMTVLRGGAVGRESMELVLATDAGHAKVQDVMVRGQT